MLETGIDGYIIQHGIFMCLAVLIVLVELKSIWKFINVNYYIISMHRTYSFEYIVLVYKHKYAQSYQH